jgi:hypothetical protein
MSTSGSDDAAMSEVERLRAERDELQTLVGTLQRRRRWGAVVRRVAVIVLVVLACVSLTGATVALWANRTLLTSDGWVKTVGPLGSDPAVTAALEPRITEAVFTVIPAQQLIADALPQDRAFLAVPLSSAIQSFVNDQVGALLATDEFANLWTDVNRAAHDRALAVLRGDSDVVQVQGDTVTLNLLPVVNQVLSQLSNSASGLLGTNVTLPTITSGEVPAEARQRLSAALGVDLPEDIGQIPVYKSDELIVAQQALRAFDQTLWLLVIATPVLLVAAVWLSRHRRSTILQLSIGSVLLLVVVRRVTLRFQEAIVALPPRPEGRAAAQAVTDQLRDTLFNTTGAVIIVGLVVVALALVTGPYGWAVALRRGVAGLGRSGWDASGSLAAGADAEGAVGWITEHRQALQLGGALLVIVVLLLVDVSWPWFLVILTLLALWEFVLWRLGADGQSGSTASIPAPQ